MFELNEAMGGEDPENKDTATVAAAVADVVSDPVGTFIGLFMSNDDKDK